MGTSLFRVLLRVTATNLSPAKMAVSLAFLVLATWGTGAEGKMKPAGHAAFDSPEAAVAALVDTVRKDDHAGLASILGDERLTPRNQEEDRADALEFLKSYDAGHSIDQSRPRVAILSVGQDHWIFPVPITLQGKVWRFDTLAGMGEIFNRQIGRNELLTIETLKAYAAAQWEFAAKRANEGGARQFACRFMSVSGKKNGLYWQVPAGGEESPVGPLVAQAAREECQALGVKPVAFHGYYFKVLSRQGRHASGGSYDYFVGGDMVLGFACVAYPEKYGVSGVVTFLVNQDGIVFQKDLGRKTAALAGSMTAYDPDASWTKAEAASTAPSSEAPVSVAPSRATSAPAAPATAAPDSAP